MKKSKQRLATDIHEGDRVLSGGRWKAVRYTTQVGTTVYIQFAGEPSQSVLNTDRLAVIRRSVWESRVR